MKYYIVDVEEKKIIDDFEKYEMACEYVIQYILNVMVERNDFISTIISEPKIWIVTIPVGFIIYDNIFRVTHPILYRTNNLKYLVELNRKYIYNKQIYLEWLRQSKYNIQQY